MTGGCLREWTGLTALSDVEGGQTPSGTALCRRWIAACADAPVTRPDGALLATLPQWPRIKPKRAASIGRPYSIVIAKFEIIV